MEQTYKNIDKKDEKSTKILTNMIVCFLVAGDTPVPVSVQAVGSVRA